MQSSAPIRAPIAAATQPRDETVGQIQVNASELYKYCYQVDLDPSVAIDANTVELSQAEVRMVAPLHRRAKALLGAPKTASASLPRQRKKITQTEPQSDGLERMDSHSGDLQDTSSAVALTLQSGSACHCIGIFKDATEQEEREIRDRSVIRQPRH